MTPVTPWAVLFGMSAFLVQVFSAGSYTLRPECHPTTPSTDQVPPDM
jgi:hypothetical protein